MSQSFPPRPDHPEDIAKLIEVFVCVTDPHSAVYLSAPITSGKRLLAWQQECDVNGETDEAQKAVFMSQVASENRQHAVATARRLRDIFPNVVIDPTVLADLPAWTQSDYHHFWAAVIERYAGTVVFSQDWQYSSGCSYEFLVAIRHHITTLDESLQPLSRAAGLALLTEAIDDTQAAHVPTAFLESIRAHLQNSGSREA